MKLLNILIAAIILGGWTYNATAQFSGGSGTNAEPYQITSKADMEALADSVNNGNNWSANKYFKLMNDITDSVRTVIGSNFAFTGNFFGNSKKITVSINKPNEDFVGLFGGTFGAVISDLTVDGIIVGRNYVAGIAGQTNGGKISNSSNNSDITGDNFVGGIAGRMVGGTVINACFNTGNINKKILPKQEPDVIVMDSTVVVLDKTDNYIILYTENISAERGKNSIIERQRT